MAAEHPLCCTTSVAVGQRAFNNYNGIGISLAYSPQPPTAAQLARGPTPPSHLLQPPPMLAVVLDASMHDSLMQPAIQALTQALAQLNPQTRLLLLVVGQVVSMVDLKTPRPQSWVVHSLSGQGPAVLPQLVQAADIRATPLAHCQPYLAASLAALKHYPRQQSLQHHLHIMAAAADIALFLLTASMAAWDAQHKQQQQQHPASSAQSQQQQQQQRQQMLQEQLQQPLHNTRVMVLTGLPSNSCPNAATAAEQLQHLDDQAAQQIRTMYHALSKKAASLDIPIDVITGSTAAPAALLLQEAVDMSQGRLLYQPQLRPPLAANIAAVAHSRFGWEGVLDLKLPAGVKLLGLSGPVAHNQRLPPAAYASGSSQLPVTLLTQPRAAAAVSKAVADAGSVEAAAGGQVSEVASPGSSGSSSSAGPVQWGPHAVFVPVLSTSTRFVATLELSRDWPAGSSFEVQVVCEWTAVDGRRVRQVVSQTISISDRLGPFMEGLDVPAVVLLTSQRLVAAAADAVSGKGSSGGGRSGSSSSLRLATEAPKRAVEEARLSVGMALAHVAQRLGHAHLSRRGVFGFGAQQVWQLPDELIPLALSFYQLQRGPLLNSAAALAADEEWSGADAQPSSSDSNGNNELPYARSSRHAGSVCSLMAGSWRVLMQQFMQCSPSTALRMVAPWLYVYDPGSSQFDVLPPLNLALEPDALAVLDCGSEVIIYVGRVLIAMVEGLPTPSAEQDPNSQQQQQHQPPPVLPPPTATANGHTPGAGPSSPAAAAAGGSVMPGQQQQQLKKPPQLAPVPDMAEAAAPAVRCAQALIRGRAPVPAIHIVEDTAGMVNLIRRLVPLHEDPVALQLLLLPHLNDLSPMQHGFLLDWHSHWARVAATQQQHGGYAAPRAGGARLANAEAAKGQELSFGSWYSSFGVVLKSPVGALARGGGQNVEVE